MAKKITVRLYFPNIHKKFEYCYEHDMERDFVQDAMRQWYDQEADLYFALYGYGPMDVSVRCDDEQPHWAIKACYQETLWHSFFSEGGESWHGKFSRFTDTLMEWRYREDNRNNVELKKAA